MKKFSLKKVTAAVSTAAMIASMGTMAFADGEAALQITSGENNGTNNLYSYTIDYSSIVGSGEINENGVSMLVYGKTVDAGVDGYMDEETYGNGMQILGVEQNSKEASDKKFNLVLTTNTDTNGYYFVPGKPVIVAVNATGTPKYATIKTYANAEAKDVLVTDVSLVDERLVFEAGESNKAENGTEAKVKEAAEKAVKAQFICADNVSISELSVGTYNKTDLTVPVTFKATVAKDAVFTGGTGANKTDFKVANDIVINGTVTVKYDAVNATDVTGDKKVSVSETEVKVGETISTEKIAAEFKKTVSEVTLKNIDGTVTDKLSLSYVENVNATVECGALSGETYPVTLTINAGTVSNNGLVQVGDSNLTITYQVTVTELTKIDSISGTFPSECTITNVDEWTNDKIKDAAVTKFSEVEGITVYSGDITIEELKGDAAAKMSDFVIVAELPEEFDPETSESVQVTVKVTGINPDTTNDVLKNGYQVTPFSLGTITVTLQLGTKVMLGDVNGDEKVNGSDVTTLKNHVGKIVVNEDLNDSESAKFKAADVNGDNKVNGSDVTALKNHVGKIVVSDIIGTEVLK